MKLRGSMLLALGAALVFAGSASAVGGPPPPKSGTLPPAVVKEHASATFVDTKSFSPQIDARYVYHPEHPENPVQIPELAGIKNNLIAGKLQDYLRVMARPQWPAIDQTGWTPPDPDLAVGKNHVVAVVNSALAFFDKLGNKQFQQDSQTFFGVPGGTFLFDPKCFYDRVHDRFVVLFLEESDGAQVSKLNIAVSDDGDPNGGWYRYRFEAKIVDGGTSYWLDYPGFGYNKDAIVVSGNMFGFTSGWGGVQFIVVPIAPLLSGLGATTYSLRDTGGASAQIAESIDQAATSVFGVSRSGTDSLRVYAVQSPGTAPTVTYTTVAVPTFSTPSGPAESTNGGVLDALDGRILNAVVRNGHLVLAHTIDNGGMLTSRWYDVNLSTWPVTGSPTLNQSGDIGSATTHYIMPAINMNAAGDMSVIFTGCSSAITADIVVAGRVASDPVGSMGTPAVLESSDGNHYGQYRWGDFFGCDVDPVDDTTFWGISMDVGASGGWKTSVFSWTITSSFPNLSSLTILPTSVVGGGTATGTVTLTSAAPPGGMRVPLVSSNKAAQIPASVLVSNGQTTGAFPIKTTTVSQPVTATITATRGSSQANATLRVTPIGIESIALNPTTVPGGTSSAGTVVLYSPAPAGGAEVLLSTDNTAVAQVIWHIFVPEGQTTGQFPVTTTPIGTTTTVRVWAGYPGPSVYATLTVTASVGLQSLTLTPSAFRGGARCTGTVALTLPATASTTVLLASSDPTFARAPVSVTILKGKRTGTFALTSRKVPSQKIVTITATLNGVVKSASAKINP